ncbi:MAG: ATP-dependent DNA helicase [Flavobacteriales bacterium]|nr:MAG: ATP-dependent DNA helicase [Flavobacteriales bacterium]
MNYLSELNEPQRKAVEHTEGPVMVLAGAGSGKTRVLIYRIAHLMQKGIDPFRILALTFTNKAAREMKGRIAETVGGNEAQNLWMGTFHSVFAKILRFEAEKIGYPSSFTIYDTDDAKSLLKTIVKERNLDDKVYKPNMLYNRISACKNSLITAAAYLEHSELINEDHQSRKPLFSEIFKTYQARCFKAGAMDFDDLLLKTTELLRDFPDVLYKYQDKFHYILVDEFQDTNLVQYLILKQLAARFENICVVGDDAQSIYAFRGAKIQNILDFQKDYSDTSVYKLEQNYRSTQNIVNAANSIISNNREQLHKQVWTENEAGEKIKVFKALTDNEEGLTVANQIFEIQNNLQSKNSNFAILYRTNAQSRAMEEALRKRNIPYRVYGGLSFYQRKEIKDLLAYFRLSVNQKDEEALKRVINYPARGIGQTTMEKAIVTASENTASLWEVLANPNNFNLNINAGTQNRISDFTTMIKSFSTMLETRNAFDIGSHIAKASGILKDLNEEQSIEAQSRVENIEALLNAMKEFSENHAPPPIDLPDLEQSKAQDSELRTLNEFMQDIALLTDADKDNKTDTDRVSLMTIHSAKGLEFPYVFIVGLEENLFPSQLSLNTRAELEEERRLFYVALTRAKKRAHLSYAASRYRWGSLTYPEPSRFIEEIDSKFLEMPRKERAFSFDSNRINKRAKPKAVVQPLRVFNKKLVKMNQARATGNFVADNTDNLQAGMQVEHQRFGMGKVLKLEGIQPNQKATVFFQGVGQKQLLLKFAKLKIIG